MSEMVERVARAAYERGIRQYAAGNLLPPELDVHIKERWEDIDETMRDHWRGVIRAAIEAMREPSEGMVRAANQAVDDGAGCAITTWRAMIDAALGETR